MPKLSVIVPIYNCAPYLNQCLGSILNQTFKDFELLLIDDGSTDNSILICEEFAKKDLRIRVLQQENLGAATARNVGIDSAQGEFMTFVDADDYIDVQMFEDLINLIEQKKCDIVISGMFLEKLIKKKKKIVELPKITSGMILNKHTHIHQIYQLFEHATIYGCCGKLYRSSIIRAHQLTMPENIYLCEDLYFNVIYLAHCKTIYMAENRYYYYVQRNRETMTKKYINNLWEMLNQVNEIVLDYFNEKLQVDNLYLSKVYYFTVIYAYTSFLTLFYDNCQMTKTEKLYYIRTIIETEQFQEKLSKAKRKSLKYFLMQLILKRKMTYCIYFVCWIRHRMNFSL